MDNEPSLGTIAIAIKIQERLRAGVMPSHERWHHRDYELPPHTTAMANSKRRRVQGGTMPSHGRCRHKDHEPPRGSTTMDIKNPNLVQTGVMPSLRQWRLNWRGIRKNEKALRGTQQDVSRSEHEKKPSTKAACTAGKVKEPRMGTNNEDVIWKLSCISKPVYGFSNIPNDFSASTGALSLLPHQPKPGCHPHWTSGLAHERTCGPSGRIARLKRRGSWKTCARYCRTGIAGTYEIRHKAMIGNRSKRDTIQKQWTEPFYVTSLPKAGQSSSWDQQNS